MGNLAADIPAAQSRFAGSKLVVENYRWHRGWCLGRQEEDKWVVEQGSAVAFSWGCVCVDREMEEHPSQDPCCRCLLRGLKCGVKVDEAEGRLF